jgi:hypothetical protein
MGAGQLASAVEGVISGKGIVLPDIAAAGHYDDHIGPGDAGLIIDEGGVADQNLRHVSDGVVGTGGKMA